METTPIKIYQFYWANSNFMQRIFRLSGKYTKYRDPYGGGQEGREFPFALNSYHLSYLFKGHFLALQTVWLVPRLPACHDITMRPIYSRLFLWKGIEDQNIKYKTSVEEQTYRRSKWIKWTTDYMNDKSRLERREELKKREARSEKRKRKAQNECETEWKMAQK